MSQQTKIVPVQLTDNPLAKPIQTPKSSLACKSTLIREKKVTEQTLVNFSGYLQTDGYSAYQNLPSRVLEPCSQKIRGLR